MIVDSEIGLEIQLDIETVEVEVDDPTPMGLMIMGTHPYRMGQRNIRMLEDL